MTDIRSGHEWTQLNELFSMNFPKVADFFHDDHDPSIPLMFRELTLILSSLSKFKILWSGSLMEGSAMDPRMREQGFEADIMYAPKDFILGPEQQREVFRHLPEAPGFVKLEVSPNYPLPRFEKSNGKLTIKAIEAEGSGPRYYIVEEVSPTKDKLLQPLFRSLSVNDFLGSVLDTLGLSRVGCDVISGAPALNLSMFGLNHFFGFAENFSMRSVLSGLLENFNRRSNERRNINDSAEETSSEIQNSNFIRHNHSIDFVNPNASTNSALNMDIVLAIECIGWPEIARGFFHRKRSWPDDNILAKLRQGGFHLVYKPLVKGSADSVEWRISFSNAELALFNSMDPFKRTCYRIFKALYYCELTLPKILCSYYMKTIFFWMCERLPEEAWVESNLAQIIMGLLDDLLRCLVTKHCPHYFIPECNLFAHAYEEFLYDLARRVSNMRTNPKRSVRDPGDVEARSNMHLASVYAGIGFGNAGVHLCHGMSYPIAGLVKSYMAKDYEVPYPIVPHGLSVVVTAPAVFSFTAPSCPERHIEAAKLLGADTTNVKRDDAGRVLSDTLRQFMYDLGVDDGLAALGYSAGDIPDLVKGTIPQHRVTKLAPAGAPGEEELAKLFESSLSLY